MEASARVGGAAVVANFHAVLDRREALLGLVFAPASDDRNAAKLAHPCLLTFGRERFEYRTIDCGVLWRRYRPPRPESSKYITPEGAAALRRELDELWRVKRPAVTKTVAEAAAQGDRSENAEYIYGKKQLAEIDRRVRYLSKRLTGIRVVDQQPSDTSKVYFGAWFELRDAAGSGQEVPARRPGRVELRARLHEHGLAARPRRSSAKPSARRSRWTPPTASSTTSSPQYATVERAVIAPAFAAARHPWRRSKSLTNSCGPHIHGGAKKSPAQGRASHRGKSYRKSYCNRAQLIRRTSPDRKSKFRARSASMSFVSKR